MTLKSVLPQFFVVNQHKVNLRIMYFIVSSLGRIFTPNLSHVYERVVFLMIFNIIQVNTEKRWNMSKIEIMLTQQLLWKSSFSSHLIYANKYMIHEEERKTFLSKINILLFGNILFKMYWCLNLQALDMFAV